MLFERMCWKNVFSMPWLLFMPLCLVPKYQSNTILFLLSDSNKNRFLIHFPISLCWSDFCLIYKYNSLFFLTMFAQPTVSTQSHPLYPSNAFSQYSNYLLVGGASGVVMSFDLIACFKCLIYCVILLRVMIWCRLLIDGKTRMICLTGCLVA